MFRSDEAWTERDLPEGRASEGESCFGVRRERDLPEGRFPEGECYFGVKRAERKQVFRTEENGGLEGEKSSRGRNTGGIEVFRREEGRGLERERERGCPEEKSAVSA